MAKARRCSKPCARFKKNYHPVMSASHVMDLRFYTEQPGGVFMPPSLSEERARDAQSLVEKLGGAKAVEDKLNKLKREVRDG
jgi:hypothetical protein